MTNGQLLQELTPIFCDVMDLDSIHLTPETSAADIEAWDSLAHIQLVMALSKHFHVTFTTQEITSWQTLADILSTLQAKQA